jgi:hypothetical protein
MKKRSIDFRKDDRCSGIPRNYFLCNGEEVYNVSKTLSRDHSHSDLQNLQKKNHNEKKMNKLWDCPDRAAALLVFNPTNHIKKQTERKDRELNSFGSSTPLSDYHRFIIEGPRCTDGSYVPTTQSHLTHHQRLLFPSQSSDQLVRHLQR